MNVTVNGIAVDQPVGCFNGSAKMFIDGEFREVVQTGFSYTEEEKERIRSLVAETVARVTR